jgi:fibronectin type 3 domain-containing protein
LFQQTVSTGTSYTDSNVSNGTTYYYVVTANGPSCSSVYSNEASAAPTCTPPAAPTNLAAVANNGSVALTWTASVGAASYGISRSTTAGSGYALLGTSIAAGYTDGAVVNGTTYYYVVTAGNGACNSGYSTEKSATPKCTPPSVPANVVATAGDGQIVLSWTASTGGAISYLVQRSRTQGGPYTDSTATVIGTGFTDINLADGTTYYYVVYANGSCPSLASAEVSAKPFCTPPSAPTSLLATPGDGQVTLSWTAPTTGIVVSYTLTRTSAGADSHTDIPNLKGTTYQDSPLTNGTTYSYVVSASNGTCLSVPSTPQVPATPVKACNLLAPTGVAAVAGNQQVTLTWSIPEAGSLSYVVKRGEVAGGPYDTVVSNPANPAGTSDTAVSNGTTYYYVVTASDGSCTSPNSNEVPAKPVCIPPAVPTGVTATANNSNGNITVGWSTVNLATGYTVLRGTSASGPFDQVVANNQTAASVTDLGTSLTAGTTYYYVVSACNASGTCVSSNSTPAVSAVSCRSPGVPGGIKATAGIGRVTVSWTASTGGPTSYTVSRRTGTTGSFGVIKTAVTTTSYIDSNVTDGTAYYYEVSAQNAGGVCSSANSGASSAATPRDCTVVSGATANGHTGKFNTTNPICFVTCDVINGGWGCYWQAAARTITINGSQLSCGTTPVPAPKTAGYTVIDLSAGGTQDEIWWWGTFNSPCNIPGTGLDF